MKSRLSHFLLAAAAPALIAASGANAQAITGTVSSTQEGAMEGVIVTAKKDGSTISTSVVTNEKGQYAFPADRLEPGHYTIKIRATGYFAGNRPAADVVSGQTKTADIRLNKTDNIAPQLTSSEWLASMPGTDEQKAFLQDCVNCHTLIRPLSSGFTADDFMTIIPRMGTYSPGTQPQRPQKLLPGPRGNRGIVNPDVVRKAAEYLASVNLSKNETWNYELKAFPRPKGRETHVIYTTYDLARPEAMPHDVIFHQGKAFYTDFGSQFIGEVDLKTGKVTDHPVPVMKEEQPRGVLELKPDQDGNVWASGMYQGGVYRLDTKTNKVTAFKVPDQWQGPNTQIMVSPMNHHVDGFVWTNNQEDHSLLRVNVKTGEWENLGVKKDKNGKDVNGYDLITDQANNLYLLEFGGTKIGRIDAKTKEFQYWEPELPRARPRRGHFDNAGILWYAEYGSNAVGRFDPKTEKITEWQVPVKWQMPYDEQVSETSGDIYNGSMLSDRIIRTNPKTGEHTVYLMPASSNIRRVDVHGNTVWVGSNHGASIVKMEVLD